MRAWAERRKWGSLLAGVAVLSALALAGGPAYGQAAGVGNAGDAAASTGGNSSAGNDSNNAAGTNSSAATPATSEPLLGGLLGLVLNVGGNSSNASSGTSAVSTGPASSSGNNSDTTVGQAGSGTGVIGTVFSPFITPSQSAGVSNDGQAAASTGGNSGVGNGSTNEASTNQTVTGGLLAVGINVGGNASNASTGSSAINTGAANAAGNTATNAISQQRLGAGFGVGGGALCDGFFNFGGQRVDVANAGTAQAATGDNTSVGNQSNNVATTDQNVSGGLIGIGVNLLGGNASNASDGQSAINTGEANASGNRSTTAVNQQCVQPVAFVAPPVITPGVVHVPGHVQQAQQVQGGQLARTGVDPFVLGLIAFTLLFGGLMFLVWERVEAMPVQSPPSS
jgi:hypothetical protein